jgi:hypothetical protein
MNPQDPLAQLHPLREPAMTGWWPPAPGWWVVAAALVLLLSILTWWLLKRYRANAYRRQALDQLASIRSDYLASSESTNCLGQLNALLKSVALEAYPQRQVASISGQAWVDFLNERSSQSAHFESSFATGHYGRGAAETDLEDILIRCERWIKRHRAFR